MLPWKKREDSTEKSSHEKWVRKRRYTTIVFALQNMLIGVDDGLVVSTLWIYLETMVKPEHPKVFYSLILLSYCITSIATSVIIARIADKTRNIRVIFFFCNIIACFGNLLYTVHFSPWYLVAARILCGFTYPLKSVIIGELTRVYEKDELSSKVSQVSLMFMVGYIAVPVINNAFVDVHVSIGEWKIAYGNIPGLLLATLRFFVIILSIFFLHNTSKEYDLKADKVEMHELINATDISPKTPIANHTEKTSLMQSNEQGDVENSEKQKIHNSKWVFRALFSNWDTALLIATSFVDTLLMTSFKMVDPILIYNILKWPITVVNGYLLAGAVCVIIPSLICGLGKFSDRVVYITAIFSYVGFMVLQLDYIIAFIYHHSFAFNVFLTVVRPILFTNCLVVEEIFIAGFLAKMVSTKYQTFADSIRVSAAMFGEIVAEGTSMLAYSHISIAGPIYIFILLILLILIIYRRKTLQNPQIIIH